MHDDSDVLKPTETEVTISRFRKEFLKKYLQPDHYTQLFDGNIEITKDDISNLNHLIVEKLRRYNEAGFIREVYVKFSNDKMKFFSDWKDFEKYAFLESDTIAHIVLSWKFNAIFPNYDFPQTHKLTVKLSNKIGANELFQMMLSGELDEINDLDANMYPVYAKVTFTDRSLGDELVNTVGEWVKGLNENNLEKSKVALKMKKHKKIVSKIIEYGTFITLTTNLLFLLLNYLDRLNISTVGQIDLYQLKRIFISSIIVFTSIFLVKGVSFIFGKSLYQSLVRYGQTYVFDITNGDANKVKELDRESKHNYINIMLRSIGAIVFNVLLTYITNKFIS